VVFHLQIHPGGKLLHGLEPFPELLVGVDIGIIEKASGIDPLTFQDLQRVYGARATADVE
jgi:hypothetical protein